MENANSLIQLSCLPVEHPSSLIQLKCLSVHEVPLEAFEVGEPNPGYLSLVHEPFGSNTILAQKQKLIRLMTKFVLVPRGCLRPCLEPSQSSFVSSDLL